MSDEDDHRAIPRGGFAFTYGRSRPKTPDSLRRRADWKSTMQIVSAEEKAQLEKKREELYKMQLDVQERIRKAAALGDLSENAEYHFAKEENAKSRRREEELEEKNRISQAPPCVQGVDLEF